MTEQASSSPTVGGESRGDIAPVQANRLRQILEARETGVFIALLIMCVFLSFTTPVFLEVQNLLNVGRQISLLGIMTVGMTFVLISGEVDLSVGSLYALTGLPELIGQCDRFLVMYGGRITGQFARSEFAEEPILACAMGQATHG